MPCADCAAEQRGLGRCALHSLMLFAPRADEPTTAEDRTTHDAPTPENARSSGLDSAALLSLFAPC